MTDRVDVILQHQIINTIQLLYSQLKIPLFKSALKHKCGITLISRGVVRRRQLS